MNFPGLCLLCRSSPKPLCTLFPLLLFLRVHDLIDGGPPLLARPESCSTRVQLLRNLWLMSGCDWSVSGWGRTSGCLAAGAGAGTVAGSAAFLD